LSIDWNFVTAPYAVSGISPIKLFFDNGLAANGKLVWGLSLPWAIAPAPSVARDRVDLDKQLA
jgi:hypothetical protein